MSLREGGFLWLVFSLGFGLGVSLGGGIRMGPLRFSSWLKCSSRLQLPRLPLTWPRDTTSYPQETPWRIVGGLESHAIGDNRFGVACNRR